MHRHPSWMMAGVYASTMAITSLAHATTTLEALGIDPNDNMVVTAQRFPTAIDQSLARVSVITREDIEQSQARDIKVLLQTQAGIDLSRTGGPGGQTSVFMRGANSNHVLVLMDGIRVSAAGTGAFQWELVDLATVERIEIVRGPRAARWGSDAIGGVIQIFTRQSQGLAAKAQVGSYGERGGAVSVGRGEHSLTAAYRRINGFSAQNERGFAFNPDDDGFKNHQLAGQGRLAVGGGTLSWSARWLTGDVEFDQGLSDVEQYAGHLGYQMSLDDWSLSIEGGFYRDFLETATAFGRSENITRRSQVSVIGVRSLSEDIDWSIGMDAWRESGVNVGTWQESRDHAGVWTALDGQYQALSYSGSLRLDDDERYGQETTAQIAAGWAFSDEVKLSANIGQGFRSPNFSQLFSPGFGGLFAGNPLLKPETSMSYELGLEWTPMTAHQLSISAFHTQIDDLINFSGADFQAININEAKIKGLEMSHGFSLGAWQTKTQWTWQQAEDAKLKQPLLRRPKAKGSMTVSYALRDHRLGAEVVYIGERFDVGQAALSPYVLINFTAALTLNDQWSLTGRLENLAGADYEPLVGFNAAGRSAVVGLVWRPSM